MIENLVVIDEALNKTFNMTLNNFSNKIFDVKYQFKDINKVKKNNKIQNQV